VVDVLRQLRRALTAGGRTVTEWTEVTSVDGGIVSFVNHYALRTVWS
jgi:hypothetical protein